MLGHVEVKQTQEHDIFTEKLSIENTEHQQMKRYVGAGVKIRFKLVALKKLLGTIQLWKRANHSSTSDY